MERLVRDYVAFCSFMSSLSDSHTDFDIWDTICCAKCLLPFPSKAGPTIPFWLTECGHILCNNHLSEQRGFTLPDSPSYGTRSQSELHTVWRSRHSACPSPKRGFHFLSSSIRAHASCVHRWKHRCPSGFVRFHRHWMQLFTPSRFQLLNVFLQKLICLASSSKR